MSQATITFATIEHAHYERAYEILCDGQKIGTTYKRADGLWSALGTDGWKGTDRSRREITRRLLIGRGSS
jgi:hypothetical protein